MLHALGDHFTGGLDLPQWAPVFASGQWAIPDGGLDPLGLTGPRLTKPIVCAVQGICLTIGIELMLACDVRIAAPNSTRFGQIEVKRGIYPVGGATLRFPREVGWGNAMRWLLTGDEFDAAEALRIGLVQEVDRARVRSSRARSSSPTVIAASRFRSACTRRSSRRARRCPANEATARGAPAAGSLQPLLASDDMREGLRAFAAAPAGRVSEASSGARRRSERHDRAQARGSCAARRQLSEIREERCAPVGLLVAAAAKWVADDASRTMFEEFGAAFDRLCDKGAQRDPGCRGKLALLSALYDLDRWDAAFERGVRYVQAEPQWGGSVDTAASLRGLCGMALAHFLRSDALDVLGELLADPERATQGRGRAGARQRGPRRRDRAVALQAADRRCGARGAVGLLRVAARAREGRRAAIRRPIPRARRRSRGGRRARARLEPPRGRAAADRRVVGARAARAAPPRRLPRARAAARIEAATAELLALVASGSPADAQAAAAALATFKHDPTLRARIVAATREQRDRDAREAILKKL